MSDVSLHFFLMEEILFWNKCIDFFWFKYIIIIITISGSLWFARSKEPLGDKHLEENFLSKTSLKKIIQNAWKKEPVILCFLHRKFGLNIQQSL